VNSWKVILATMVIFGTGVVTGGLLVRHVAPAPPPANAATQPPRPAASFSAGGMRIELLRRMERDLDLDPRQHAQIDKLLTESQERIRKIMEPVAPEMNEELQNTREQFRALLNSAQQVRFDALLKQQQHPRDKNRGASPHERTENSNGMSPSGVLEKKP